MKILKLTVALILVGQIFTGQGVDVTCSAATCTTLGTAPPSYPQGLSWKNGQESQKCAINNCPADTLEGITGATDLFCKSCPGVINGKASAIYASIQKNGCVASSATCGSDRILNTWSNLDCLACYGTAYKYAKLDQSGCQETVPINPGIDVTCSAASCTTVGTCPEPPSFPVGLQWQKGISDGKCAINNCPQVGTSLGLNGATDLFCKSCPGIDFGIVEAIYANVAQTGYVASTTTCGKGREANTCTDNDCLACYDESLKYAKSDKSGCQATAPPGNDVSCSADTCTTPGTCPQIPSIPLGLSWQNGSQIGKCAVKSCPTTGTSSGLTGASDLFCQSCSGTANGVILAIFANTEKTGCVASQATCGTGRTPNTWTNTDCLACNGPSLQYAKSDKSDCQALPAGSDVTCSANICTTEGICPSPPSFPEGLIWQNGIQQGKCAIKNCPGAGTSSGLIGASDLFCESCPGNPNGQVKAIFANTGLTGCVASSASCGKNRTANTWNDADCLACKGQSLKYAKSDKSDCQATDPFTVSTNSFLSMGSILLLLISLLL